MVRYVAVSDNAILDLLRLFVGKCLCIFGYMGSYFGPLLLYVKFNVRDGNIALRKSNVLLYFALPAYSL